MDIGLAASEVTTLHAAAACLAKIYSKPERVVPQPASFRKSVVDFPDDVQAPRAPVLEQVREFDALKVFQAGAQRLKAII
jgi:hypothetical protein